MVGIQLCAECYHKYESEYYLYVIARMDDVIHRTLFEKIIRCVAAHVDLNNFNVVRSARNENPEYVEANWTLDNTKLIIFDPVDIDNCCIPCIQRKDFGLSKTNTLRQFCKSNEIDDTMLLDVLCCIFVNS